MNYKFFRIFLTLSVCTLCLTNCDSRYKPIPKVYKKPITKVVLFAHQAPVSEADRKADPAFHKMMDVLTDKKCVNCHPSDGIPRQGEDSHKHLFGMAGGKNNHGFEATQCSTCHQDANNNFSGVPGAPDWALAPASMKWFDLSRVEIAQSMLSAKNNGGLDHKGLVDHLTKHELVLWAWEPGINAAGEARVPVSVPKAEYIEAVKTWFDAGAIIPGETKEATAKRASENAAVFASDAFKNKQPTNEEH